MTQEIQEIQEKPPYFSGFDVLPNEYNSRMREDGTPFYLKAKNAKAVVICLHGFSANTYESRPVAEACVKIGIDAIGSLMPAHGYKDNEPLYQMWSSISAEDLLEGLRNDIKLAREKYEKVFIYGQSMGGTLTVKMAGEELVDAAAATAPGIVNIPKILLPSIKLLLTIFKKKEFKTNPTKKFYNSAYESIPLVSVKFLLNLMKDSRKIIQNISCPLYLVLSENDDLINPKRTMKSLKDIRTNTKIEWFNKCGHTMPLDVEGEEICESIAQFFKEQC
ncbi:MAG: prolyl oligopeptidase family serine peptidase [archaeon]|nr:prolyl oligopeptidase family serine peptidase [archaeon]